MVAALLAGLAACGGEPAPGDLPAGADQVSGSALVASWSTGPEGVPEFLRLDEFGRRLGLEFRPAPRGWLVATAPEVVSGWSSLSDSPLFREAFASRRGEVGDAWVYADLQGLVDLAMVRLVEVDRRVRELASPLGLSTLEWAIASVRRSGEHGLEAHGILRSTGSDVGAVAVLSGAAAPSLLGPERDGERLRIEVRADPQVARRTVEAWLTEDRGGGAFSMRDALAALLGQAWQELTDQIDGTVSLVVDEAGTVAAVGLRESDDTRDLLDRYFRPDGPDVWRGPGGRRVTVVGSRLVLGDSGVDVPAAGGAVVDLVLLARFSDARGRAVRIEVRRADARTLEILVRVD